MNERVPYLIIGNSAAAIGAIEGLRTIDKDTPITLVAKEQQHTYSRPLISYLLGGKVDEARMPYRSTDFYEKNKTRTLLGVEATHVDPDAKTVSLSDGGTISFGKLLIATGGSPIVPKDVDGVDAEGVFTFTTWNDALEIQRFIEKNNVRQAVVVGGGLIGLKSLEALMALGIQTTLVELADRILSITFDQTASSMAQKVLSESGADVRCGTTVSRIQKRDGRVLGATLKDGSQVSCQMVLFAIGVIPNLSTVKGTAIATDRGILVDEHLETSVKGIFAAGDVAQGADILEGVKRPIPILPVAYRQGLVAGDNMAGKEKIYLGGMAMNAVDVCGVSTISVGITAPTGGEYEILKSLDEDTPSYKKIVLKNNRIVGAIFIGDVERAGIFTGLIKDKVDVSGFKEMLLNHEFGLISLPKDYRKHVVSGMGIEV